MIETKDTPGLQAVIQLLNDIFKVIDTMPLVRNEKVWADGYFDIAWLINSSKIGSFFPLPTGSVLDWKTTAQLARKLGLIDPAEPKRTSCNRDGEDIFCACGCGADDSRCDYWIYCYNNRVPVADDHTCCKTGIPDHVL